VTPHVLLVEDDPLTVEAVSFSFEREGWSTTALMDGQAVLDAVDAGGLDVVVLDVGLPNVSGLELCRLLRARSDVPILMLTARSSELDKVLALELGADDYVVKPHSTRELIARVRALLRRRDLDAAPGETRMRRVGGLEIDVARHEVVVDGSPVWLTPSEMKILALLSERPGTVVSRRELVSTLWSSDYVGDTRSCDAHVARLRRKVEPNPLKPSRIVTVRGEGYKLVAL
jgi:two-component system response regulator RegX3